MTTPMPYPLDTDEASGSKAFRDSTVTADANFQTLATNFNTALTRCTRLVKVAAPVFTPVAGVTVHSAHAWTFGATTGSGYIDYLHLALKVPASLAFNTKLGTYSSSLVNVYQIVCNWCGLLTPTGGRALCYLYLGAPNTGGQYDVFWGYTLNGTANPAGMIGAGITFQSNRWTQAP
jgi:hypothetical protein